MSQTQTRVFPVHNNIFKFGVNGLQSTAQQMLMPANMESFSPSFNNTIEEWFAMDQEGWGSSLMTGKKIVIQFKGKRTIGDPANDYIAGLMLENGMDAQTPFEWTLPDGMKVAFPVTIAVTNNGGGETTNVGGLEFEVHSNGKPTVTLPETTSGSTSESTSESTPTSESENGGNG